MIARESVKKHLVGAAAFFGKRQAAWFEWVGGIIGCEVLVSTTGINQWLGTLATTAVVTGIERAQVRSSEPALTIDKKDKSLLGRIAVEGGALWSSAYSGAAATQDYNTAAGIDKTNFRLWAQSATYGAAVGLYTTPLVDGPRRVKQVYDYALENPIEAGLLTAVTSTGIYAGYQAIGHMRANKRTKLPPSM